MFRSGIIFIAYCMGVKLSATVMAQVGPSPEEMRAIGLYYENYSTRDDFDQIPYTLLQWYAINKFAHYGSHDVLTPNDLSVLKMVESINGEPDVDLDQLQLDCTWYSEEKAAGNSASSAYLASLIAKAYEMGKVNVQTIFDEAFALLSDPGRTVLLAEIESLRGTGRMGVSHLNISRLADERPDLAASLFIRMCETFSSDGFTTGRQEQSIQHDTDYFIHNSADDDPRLQWRPSDSSLDR